MLFILHSLQAWHGSWPCATSSVVVDFWDLETPVYRYLPDFRMADPRYQPITARMLLNHSAGLRGDDLINDSLFIGDNSIQGYG
ncbi:MAG TPA: hypothetical protein DEO64_09435 [Alcaligenes faecalis]|nr:hypothetical protein [Alcaligenes faecalis]